MIRRTRQELALWFGLADLAATALAWVCSYWLRFSSGWFPSNASAQPEAILYWQSLPAIVLMAALAYYFAGMYEVHRLWRFREELLAVGRGVVLMALAVMAASFAQRHHYESRLAMALFVALTAGSIVGSRRLMWWALHRLRSHGINQSHALIVGGGRLARRTAATLRAVPWTGIQPVGYVEDEPWRRISDLPVLGSIAQLPELVQRHHIEHVFVALPLNRYADARRVFALLGQTTVDIQLVADIPEFASLAFHTTHLHGMTIISLRENPHYGLNVVIKRAMDIILSLVAIILLAPLMAIIALLIKLTSPGPVLYRQERCGLNGRPFQMLKFRTMHVDAEKDGPQMTRPNDPRRTRLGALLRATNLDELPQLFNVLKGDMSLVGPRPERPVFVQQFQKTIPNYMARHAVKAGMTGWAQVNGWRGNSSLRRRVQFDLYYITHWNPLFDLRILVLTVWRMLFGKQKNAY
ncbi:MAG: undecaprenyl-phosphate glucose phosphotransferase [Gemmataceae bacterium]|nr:undecaprenyl-phosphate glucose phosphotransferase [Gemmataceae bacterium]